MNLRNKCRTCLSSDRRMYAVSNTMIQEMWEKLTNARFNSDDGKPVVICYICCVQLSKCHQMMKRALKAEELLMDYINSGSEKSQQLILAAGNLSNDLNYNVLKPEYCIVHKETECNTVEKLEENTKDYEVVYEENYKKVKREMKEEIYTDTDEEGNTEEYKEANVEFKVERNVEDYGGTYVNYKEVNTDIKEDNTEYHQQTNEEDFNEAKEENVYIYFSKEGQASSDPLEDESLDMVNAELSAHSDNQPAIFTMDQGVDSQLFPSELRPQRKVTQATEEQIKELLFLMRKHSDLAKGLLRGPEGRIRSKQLWTKITNRLNSLGGSQKTEKQWMKVWADKKYLAKRAIVQSRREATGIGGGPPAPLVGELLTVMGQGFGLPQSNARAAAPHPERIQPISILESQNTVISETPVIESPNTLPNFGSATPREGTVEIPLNWNRNPDCGEDTVENDVSQCGQVNTNRSPERISSNRQVQHSTPKPQKGVPRRSRNDNRSQLIQNESICYEEFKLMRMCMERTETIFSEMLEEIRKFSRHFIH